MCLDELERRLERVLVVAVHHRWPGSIDAQGPGELQRAGRRIRYRLDEDDDPHLWRSSSDGYWPDRPLGPTGAAQK